MSIVKKLLSLFESSLSNDQIKALANGLLEYAKEMPNEVFEGEPDGYMEYAGEDEDPEVRVDGAEVRIIDPLELLDNIKDGEDFEVDVYKLTDAELSKIFSSLERQEFTIRSEIVYSGYSSRDEKERCYMSFKVNSLHYNKAKKVIDVKVSNISIE